MDELNRARPEILQTIMDLALNRTLAGKSLPPGSRIISAVNAGDEYQITDLDPALVSRFNIYEFCPTVSEWLLWASKEGVDPRIIDFISHNSEFLDGDGKNIEEGSLEKTPDRRAWSRVSEILSGIKDVNETIKKMIAGIIGTRTTSLFFESLKNSNRLSAVELLTGNFSDTEIILSHYQTPDFAVLNDGIFRTLETSSFNEGKASHVASNLKAYFSYLEKNGWREAMAHFANMFAGKSYPNSLMFIIQNTPDLYKEVTRFVGEIR